MQQLISAISAAQAGAQQLSAGMVELQAGTGQLGSGATELADAIGQVVEQVTSFEAVRGQILAAIDRTLTGLEDAQDPDALAARDSSTLCGSRLSPPSSRPMLRIACTSFGTVPASWRTSSPCRGTRTTTVYIQPLTAPPTLPPG
ncbi:hypothetical protein JKI95_06010 [Corynebacterium aquatimens]|uniref:hypothetical protein n=1 Tax=Corynebacterium aquatimens TaxID=1190508 RepID=UPI00253FD9E4|nr:hypothetical protein [Corynebacterium aquatimens]QYH20399.1 hypothetical protein JKI95_06010 [Corynebacterium aquatimens]